MVLRSRRWLPLVLATSLAGCTNSAKLTWEAKDGHPVVSIFQRLDTSADVRPPQPTNPSGTSASGVVLSGFVIDSADQAGNTAEAQTSKPRYLVPPPQLQQQEADASAHPITAESHSINAPPATLDHGAGEGSLSSPGADPSSGDGPPPMLLPAFSIRSIYDKLRVRPRDVEQEEPAPMPYRRRSLLSIKGGPNAEPAATLTASQPVALGRPETEVVTGMQRVTREAGSVMQTCPSSFRGPLLANPDAGSSPPAPSVTRSFLPFDLGK